MRLTIGSCLVAVLIAAWSSAARAEWSDDAEAPGRAASMSYRAMQGPVAVQPLDNSDLNIEVAKRIEQALRERGIAVADDAPLLLEFETATESSAQRRPRGVPPEPKRVDIGRERDLGRRDSVDARIDLYSNTRSSVLTGVRRPEASVLYTLRATVSERDGARLWEGYTEYGEIASDERRLFAAMAPLLASMVGQSTGERRFRPD